MRGGDMVVTKITKRFVESAPPGRWFDSELKGFGLHVGAGGTRSYFLEYRVGYGRAGRKRRMVIARHGVLTPAQARAEAIRLLALVRAGGDPLEQKRRGAGEAVQKLAEVWLAEVSTRRKPRTAALYGRWMRVHVIPVFGVMDVARIGRADVARLHTTMRATPAEANNVVRALSVFMSWCEQHGYRPDGSNPCRHVERYKERARERFLSAKELRRLSRVLRVARQRWPWPVAAIRLLLFTGCRLNEILTLKWTDVAGDVIRLRDSKTGPKVIHLNEPTRRVLSELPRMSGNPFVMVGRGNQHLVNLDKPWQRIRKAALISDVRLHDLRHSYASIGILSGLSMEVIEGLLGHSHVTMTERYAHLGADPLKRATEIIGKLIEKAMTLRDDT
jgi:integrase